MSDIDIDQNIVSEIIVYFIIDFYGDVHLFETEEELNREVEDILVYFPHIDSSELTKGYAEYKEGTWVLHAENLGIYTSGDEDLFSALEVIKPSEKGLIIIPGLSSSSGYLNLERFRNREVSRRFRNLRDLDMDRLSLNDFRAVSKLIDELGEDTSQDLFAEEIGNIGDEEDLLGGKKISIISPVKTQMDYKDYADLMDKKLKNIRKKYHGRKRQS